jgi:hypothetical protein
VQSNNTGIGYTSSFRWIISQTNCTPNSALKLGEHEWPNGPQHFLVLHDIFNVYPVAVRRSPAAPGVEPCCCCDTIPFLVILLLSLWTHAFCSSAFDAITSNSFAVCTSRFTATVRERNKLHRRMYPHGYNVYVYTYSKVQNFMEYMTVKTHAKLLRHQASLLWRIKPTRALLQTLTSEGSHEWQSVTNMFITDRLRSNSSQTKRMIRLNDAYSNALNQFPNYWSHGCTLQLITSRGKQAIQRLITIIILLLAILTYRWLATSAAITSSGTSTPNTMVIQQLPFHSTNLYSIQRILHAYRDAPDGISNGTLLQITKTTST